MPQQLTLYKVLEVLLDKLEEKQVLNLTKDERDVLLNKALENITSALGGAPLSVEQLKNPEMLMKLTQALIATHVMEKNPSFTFDFNLLMKNPLQDHNVQLELKKMLKEFATQDPEGAKNLNQFIVDFAKEVLDYFELNPEMAPTPKPGEKAPLDEMKDSLKKLCDGEGNVINVFQSDRPNDPSDAILTLTGLLTIASAIVPKLEEANGPLQELEDRFRSIQMAPSPSPYTK